MNLDRKERVEWKLSCIHDRVMIVVPVNSRVLGKGDHLQRELDVETFSRCPEVTESDIFWEH